MDINFVKISPTANMTILVQNPVPREQHSRVASALMAYDGVYAEQVGFIEQPENKSARARLQMMGGEFCGNATMSMAAYLLWKDKTPPGKQIEVPLESSGTQGLVRCNVETLSGAYRCSLEMPVPKQVQLTTLELDGQSYESGIVHLDGITHIILPAEQVRGDRKAFAERAIREWGAALEDDARGLMLFDAENMCIEPLVQVVSANSLVWERGCGSGTASVGVYLAYTSGRDACVDVAQPGGVISVKAIHDGNAVTWVGITGTSRIVAEGTAFIAD